MSEDLYWRLHSLATVLESSGRIDQSEHRDAYPTILDAMNFVRAERAGGVRKHVICLCPDCKASKP